MFDILCRKLHDLSFCLIRFQTVFIPPFINAGNIPLYIYLQSFYCSSTDKAAEIPKCTLLFLKHTISIVFPTFLFYFSGFYENWCYLIKLNRVKLSIYSVTIP